jgi:hypothetical protein
LGELGGAAVHPLRHLAVLGWIIVLLVPIRNVDLRTLRLMISYLIIGMILGVTAARPSCVPHSGVARFA